MSGEKREVFISYNRKNFDSAQRLYDSLTEVGISSWLDSENLLAGEEWSPLISQRIEKTDFFIVLCSSKITQKKGYFYREIDKAIDRYRVEDGLTIISIRLDECELPHPELNDIHWLDFFPDWDTGFRRLVKALTTQQEKQRNLEIIGFDLGHGETAISKTTLYSTSEPKPIDINRKTSIITAVAMSEGQIVIGDDAFTIGGKAVIDILFKSYELEKPEVREPIIHFVSTCLKILKDQGKLELNDKTQFFVGSPSGWTDDNKKEYEEVLREAGMQNVSVRPESRAAFLEAKESKELAQSLASIPGAVLIMDIGSSTTDFTIVKDYKETPLDFGHNNLGAGLFDEAIFEKMLNTQQEKEILEKLLSERTDLKSQCLLKCREVKERYFSATDQTSFNEHPLKEVFLLENQVVKIELLTRDMDEIIYSPMPKLKNKPWPVAFEEELLKIKESEEYEDPYLILMTGGGSRIGFLKPMCETIFSPAKVRVGLDPQLSISKGLGLVGRIDLKTDYFLEDVKGFTETGLLRSAVDNSLPDLWDKLATQAYNQVGIIVKRNFKKWVDGEIELVSGLEKVIESEAKMFFSDSTKVNDAFKEELYPWVINMSEKIERMTHKLCERYDIPKNTFNLSVSLDTIGTKGGLYELLNAKDIIRDNVAITSGAFIGLSLATIIAGIITISDWLYWGLSLTFGGIIGWLITLAAGTIGGVFLTFFTVDKIDKKQVADFIRNTNIPDMLRVISDEDLDKMIENGASNFKADLIDKLETDIKEERFILPITNAIKEEMLSRADKVRVLIQ